MSYIPAGTYDIDGDKLLLYIDDNPKTATIEFTIEDDTLIFQSGELVDETIEKGSQFTFIGWTGNLGHDSVSKEEFIEYNNSLAYKPLYEICMQDGYVAEIFEKYTP